MEMILPNKNDFPGIFIMSLKSDVSKKKRIRPALLHRPLEWKQTHMPFDHCRFLKSRSTEVIDLKLKSWLWNIEFGVFAVAVGMPATTIWLFCWTYICIKIRSFFCGQFQFWIPTFCVWFSAQPTKRRKQRKEQQPSTNLFCWLMNSTLRVRLHRIFLVINCVKKLSLFQIWDFGKLYTLQQRRAIGQKINQIFSLTIIIITVLEETAWN